MTREQGDSFEGRLLYCGVPLRWRTTPCHHESASLGKAGQAAMLLIEILPVLADELEQLLEKAEESDLAAQVSQLKVVERCRCGDDCCASFYTQLFPEGRYGPGSRTVELKAPEGMLILDILDGTIVHVDVLNRKDFRQKLLAALP
jgi:hypothetical protein